MNRRNGTLGSLVAGLWMAAAIGAGPAQALRGGEQPLLAPYARAELQMPEGVVPVNYLLVLNGELTLALDLRKAVPQFNEDRFDVSTMIDALIRPPLRRLLGAAQPVGKVYLWSSSLFVVPEGGDIRAGHASIVHRDVSFQPQPSLLPVKLKQRPTMAELEQIGSIGLAYQTDRRLILLVRPTPVDGEF